MIEAFKDRCDNWEYIMRNMESEKARQTKFFRKDDKDEKKKEKCFGSCGWNGILFI